VPQRGANRALVAGLIIGDAAALLTALTAALLLRAGLPVWPGDARASPETPGLIALIAPLCLALFAMWGLYRPGELFSGHREYQRAVHACTYAAFGVLTLSFLLSLDISRGALMLGWLLCCFFVCLERFALRRVVARLRRGGRFVRRALVIGADEHAIAIAHQLGAPGSGWQVLGFLDDYRPVGANVTDRLIVLGDPAAAERLAAELDASDLIMVPHAVSWEAQRDLLERAASHDRPLLHLAPGLYHLLATSPRQIDGPAPLVTLDQLRITGLDATLKTALDATLAAAGLPAVAVLVALLRGLAALSGGGPLLERRQVLGPRSRRFDLLAVAPPPAAAGPTWARLFRASLAAGRLSKLPNVVNVLLGRMSFVGPRAIPAGDDAGRPPWVHTLLLVRPGITGPRFDDERAYSAEEQVIRDVAYVRRYSLWVDLQLLVTSVGRLLRRQPSLPAAYASEPSDAAVAAPAEAAVAIKAPLGQ